MGCPLVLVTDGNPKVWEAINLFQLYTTEDIFSQGWIVLMWDGNNFAFGRIELHLPSVTDDCTLSGKSFIYNRNCYGPGTVPWVRQKSPDIDLMFGLHKQQIENVDTGVTPEARQWLSQPNKY